MTLLHKKNILCMFPASDYYKLNKTAITYQKKGLGVEEDNTIFWTLINCRVLSPISEFSM